MAFFGLFKKKKKKDTHTKLQGAAPPSPPSPPPPTPPKPDVRVSNNGSKQRPVQAMDSIRQQSLFTQGGVDIAQNVSKVTTTERIPAPAAPPVAASPPPPAISESAVREFEANQAAIDLTRSLVKRFIADIWNRGEVDLIPEVCSSSLRFNGNTGFDRVGHEGLARMVNTIREALDDYHCEIHSMVVENNKAFCRLRFTGKRNCADVLCSAWIFFWWSYIFICSNDTTGKHTGNLLGYPPTRKVVAWMGATEFTCQNGKILKVWELGDIKTLEEQLTTEVEMDEV